MTPEERFWFYVPAVHADSECWNWQGRCFAGIGYPVFKIAGRQVYAHRFSYELHHRKSATGMCVCHHCDNPRCVNPAHLFLGTQKDNMDDAVQKGRVPKGEDKGTAILTTVQVAEMLALKSLGTKQLAIRFGVSAPCVSMILAGKRWKHMREAVCH